MSSHELPPSVASRRFRLEVADGAHVEVIYTQDSSSATLEIMTEAGTAVVPVSVHLLIAVAESVLELANELGPITEPEPTPEPMLVPVPTMEPQFFDPDASVVTPEVPAPEGLV